MNQRDTPLLVDDAIVDRIAARLLQQAPGLDTHGELIPDWAPTLPFERPPVLAAVLIGLVMRPEGHTILYTERSRELRAHSGQVAFPGGKIDPSDIDAADAALREAGEEVGLRRHEARVLGYLPTYYTGTNYLITPVVAEIIPTHPFVPNPSEVYSLFEVPLARVLDLGSYGQYRIKRNGEEHRTWQIDHDGHVIWGITANLTRRFRDIALGEGGQ